MRDEPQKTDEASYSQVYAYQKPKRYGFLEDHARLITFLICVAFFWLFFGRSPCRREGMFIPTAHSFLT